MLLVHFSLLFFSFSFSFSFFLNEGHNSVLNPGKPNLLTTESGLSGSSILFSYPLFIGSENNINNVEEDHATHYFCFDMYFLVPAY